MALEHNEGDLIGQDWWTKTKRGFSSLGKDVQRGARRTVEIVSGDDKKILLFVSGDWKFTKDDPFMITVIRKRMGGVKEKYKAYYISDTDDNTYYLKIKSLNARDKGKTIRSQVLEKYSVVKIDMRYWDRANDKATNVSYPLIRYQTAGVLIDNVGSKKEELDKYNMQMKSKEAVRAERDGRLHVGQPIDDAPQPDIFPHFVGF